MSDKGWEVAVCNVDLTDKGRELFGREQLVSKATLSRAITACMHAFNFTPG